jgi:linoleoyl-CoA desaturase
MLHPWWGVVAFYLVSSWCVGFLLAVIFQMAHCNDVADFVLPDRSHRGAGFQLHQLTTTIDIRCDVPVARWFVRWLMAGLDHQIAHHLAPSVPHTLYGTLSRRVEAVCVAHGLPHRQHASITAALRSHGRWLRLMAQPPPLATATVAASTALKDASPLRALCASRRWRNTATPGGRGAAAR